MGSVLRSKILFNTRKALSYGDENASKRFFDDESDLAVFSTAEKLAEKLAQHKINYAFVGGFALNIHGFKRQTTDVDVLMNMEDLRKFQADIVYNGFTPRFRDAKKSFRDPVSNVGIVIIVSGEFPGDGQPKDIQFPVPDNNNIMDIGGMKIINLPTLINLKLSSFKSLPQRRMKDRTDVAGLVKNLSLGVTFADKLHNSVREEFLAVVEEVIAEEASKSE